MPTLTDPAVLNLARHFVRCGGWLTVTTVDGLTQYRAAGEQMLAAGHITRAQAGSVRTYRLTAAGRAWLNEQES